MDCGRGAGHLFAAHRSGAGLVRWERVARVRPEHQSVYTTYLNPVKSEVP